MIQIPHVPHTNPGDGRDRAPRGEVDPAQAAETDHNARAIAALPPAALISLGNTNPMPTELVRPSDEPHLNRRGLTTHSASAGPGRQGYPSLDEARRPHLKLVKNPATAQASPTNNDVSTQTNGAQPSRGEAPPGPAPPMPLSG